MQLPFSHLEDASIGVMSLSDPEDEGQEQQEEEDEVEEQGEEKDLGSLVDEEEKRSFRPSFQKMDTISPLQKTNILVKRDANGTLRDP